MTQRYILVRRRHTAFRYPSNKRISSYVRFFPSVRLRLSRSLLPLPSRAGSRLGSFPFGRAVGWNSITDIPHVRRRRNFRRVSTLLASTSQILRSPFIDTWLNLISRDGNSEEVSAEEGYEISNFRKILRGRHVSKNRQREVKKLNRDMQDMYRLILTILLYF